VAQSFTVERLVGVGKIAVIIARPLPNLAYLAIKITLTLTGPHLVDARVDIFMLVRARIRGIRVGGARVRRGNSWGNDEAVIFTPGYWGQLLLRLEAESFGQDRE
jgi:hypothetical protein